MAEKETTRVEAFSDGVFAIAITLLVLGLVEPHIEATTTNEELFKGLWHIWPSYLGFIISFTTILIMWINHHEIFRIVGTVNKKFLISNGVLLMMVTFINFPTKVFSSQLQTDSAVAAERVRCRLAGAPAYAIWGWTYHPRDSISSAIVKTSHESSVVRVTRVESGATSNRTPGMPGARLAISSAAPRARTAKAP